MSKIEESVIAKIRERQQAGSRKYGTTMERSDLQQLDWLRHAQEEAMDLAIYLEKLMQLEPRAAQKSTMHQQADPYLKEALEKARNIEITYRCPGSSIFHRIKLAWMLLMHAEWTVSISPNPEIKPSKAP